VPVERGVFRLQYSKKYMLLEKSFSSRYNQIMRRVATCVALALMAVCLGAYLARDATTQVRKEHAKAQQAHDEMVAAESQRALLLKQKSYLESASGKEKTLRDRGYVRTGERPL